MNVKERLTALRQRLLAVLGFAPDIVADPASGAR